MVSIDVEKYRDDIIKDIIRLVSINSVIDKEEKNAPFGKGIRKALEECVAIAKELSFKTYIDEEGYYGYADIGEGETLIGILGHLDVVPADENEGWIYPPFKPTLIENKLYGRGTQDDKGPIIASMYGMKALIDMGVKINKRIRFIFGTDEETLWRCINKYMEKEEKPSYGFSPDSMFPMIHGEKGLLQCTLKGKAKGDVSIHAGNAFNAVPEKASFISENPEEFEKILIEKKYEYKREDNLFTVLGKAAHAAKPELGINSIVRLCSALKSQGSESKSINFIGDVLDNSYYGEKIIENCKDISGNLTINLGKLDITKEEEIISLDIRIPVTYSKEEFVEKLKIKALEYDLEYEEYDFLKSIYLPVDHFLIKKLRKVYEERTGLDSTPLTSGGATYARSMDNCVAFGSVFPGKPKTEHQANEFIDIDDLIKSTDIYAYSIYELLE